MSAAILTGQQDWRCFWKEKRVTGKSFKLNGVGGGGGTSAKQWWQ